MDDCEFIEEDYYGDDDAIDSDYDFDHIMPDDDVVDTKPDKKTQNYTILSEGRILKRQEEDINHVSSVLSVSKSWASLLLRKFQWNVNRVNDEWFADEEKARKIVGLVKNSSVVVKVIKKIKCHICLDNCCFKETHAAMCGHRYCKDCWVGYISTAIKDGPGCLSLRCPDPDCYAAMDEELIVKLVSDEYKKKYTQYLFRSYVEDNRNTKWCPAPGCEFAVEFHGGDGNFDVCCLCSHEFCYNCIEERHRPVDCDTVSKWLIKNSSESENTNWIFVNSKPCPKCKRNIEKNQGCNHMTCNQQCGYQFCWLCLGDWKNHKSSYHCNVYEDAKKKGIILDEDETRRERAKQSLEKYTHYYERWLGNRNSMAKAAGNLDEVQKTHRSLLAYKMMATDKQLEFITEAWLQIIECRRVLKWSYAYGYYLPVHNQAQKKFFEFLQGEAESALEKLHECAETDMLVFLKNTKEETKTNEDKKTENEKEKEKKVVLEEFENFRFKLNELRKANKTYFDNLVGALENGLSDVYHGAYGGKQEEEKEQHKKKKRKISRK